MVTHVIIRSCLIFYCLGFFLSCLILVLIGFPKNGNSDNNLAPVSSLILGFIVFQKNGNCFNEFLICEAIIISLSDKHF